MMEANINSLKSFRSDLFRFLDAGVLPDSGMNGGELNHCGTNLDEVAWKQSIKYSEIKKCRLLIINGCVPPAGIERIMAEHGSCIRQVVFVCKNKEKFILNLRWNDYSKWIQDERFEFYIGLEEKHLSACLKDFFSTKDRLIYRERIGFFNYWPDIELDGKYYVRFAEMVPQILSQMLPSLHAPDEDAYRGFLNLSKNMFSGRQMQRIDGWKNVAKGRPAVLIASGPSLQFHLEHLRKLDGKFIVGCCDSALKAVLEQGVEPNFCFSLERSASIGKLFTGISANIKTILVTLPICHPTVLENYPGAVAFMTTQNAYSQWLRPNAPVFSLGSSVATMALRFYSFLGINHVNLLGQDLAFDPISSHSHFSGVRSEILDVERERFDDGGWCELESNSGHKIKSSAYWKLFLDEMNVYISKFSMKCMNVIPETHGARLDTAVRIDPDVFWADVQSTDAFEFSLDALGSVGDFSGNDRGFASLVDQTLDQLQILKRNILIYLDDMSLALLECFPESRDQFMISFYRDKLLQWSLKEEVVQNSSVYRNLIKFIMPGSHLRLFTERENLFLEDETFVTEISRYIGITQEWLKNVSYWIDRVCHVIEKK